MAQYHELTNFNEVIMKTITTIIGLGLISLFSTIASANCNNCSNDLTTYRTLFENAKPLKSMHDIADHFMVQSDSPMILISKSNIDDVYPYDVFYLETNPNGFSTVYADHINFGDFADPIHNLMCRDVNSIVAYANVSKAIATISNGDLVSYRHVNIASRPEKRERLTYRAVQDYSKGDPTYIIIKEELCADEAHPDANDSWKEFSYIFINSGDLKSAYKDTINYCAGKN